MKRRRHPRVPEFPPLEELAPGAPFNPFRLFVSGSVLRAIAALPKLGPGQKLVWIVLADQCLRNDYDWHTHRELATLCGMSQRQFRRHLARLRKLKLVHVAPELGRSDHTWLLYHPAFAFCTPLPQVTSVLGGRSEVSEGVGQKRPTHGLNSGLNHGLGGATRLKGTSSRGAPDWNGGREGEVPGEEETGPAVPITESLSTLQIARDARSFWYSLSPIEKRNRREAAERSYAEVIHFRQYLKDSDPNIQRQARHEVERAVAAIRGYGFTLHDNNGRKA